MRSSRSIHHSPELDGAVKSLRRDGRIEKPFTPSRILKVVEQLMSQETLNQVGRVATLMVILVMVGQIPTVT